MKRNKAQGPDGHMEGFFKENWNVVGEEVSKAIKYCFDKYYMYHALNSTIISLIPKVKNPACMKEYRPISSCNVVYKIFSKVLKERLKEVLSFIISKQ